MNNRSQSELTKLKRLWQKPDFEPSRERWRQRFSSKLTQAQIRPLLKKELHINLQWDRQLTQFRQWVDRQDALDAQIEAAADDERRIREQLGDCTLEQFRLEVLKRSYLRALATGDLAAGRQTIAQEMNVKEQETTLRKVILNEQEFSYYKEDTQARALEKVLKDTDQCPNARNQFKAAFAALTEEQYTNDFGRSQSGELDNALKRCLWETEKYPRARQQFKTALAVLKEEQEKERFADPPGYVPTPSEGPSNPIQPDPTKSNPSVCSSGRKSAPSSPEPANTPSPRQAAAGPAQPVCAPSAPLPTPCLLLLALFFLPFQHFLAALLPAHFQPFAFPVHHSLSDGGSLQHLALICRPPSPLLLFFTYIFTLILPCFIAVYSCLFMKKDDFYFNDRPSLGWLPVPAFLICLFAVKFVSGYFAFAVINPVCFFAAIDSRQFAPIRACRVVASERRPVKSLPSLPSSASSAVNVLPKTVG